MAELIHGPGGRGVRADLDACAGEIAAAGDARRARPRRRRNSAAVKYVPLDEMGVLAEAGITLAGENRAQDLVAKAGAGATG